MNISLCVDVIFNHLICSHFIYKFSRSMIVSVTCSVGWILKQKKAYMISNIKKKKKKKVLINVESNAIKVYEFATAFQAGCDWIKWQKMKKVEWEGMI